MSNFRPKLQMNEAIKFLLLHKTIKQNECILWLGSGDKDGYPRAWIEKKRYRLHRLLYEKIHGPIPVGIFICHKCDNVKCLNIRHLLAGTPKDNFQDMVNKGRNNPNIGARTRFKKGMIPINRKLNSQNILEIRSLNKGNITHKEIAKKFNVSRTLIGQVMARIAWPSVT